MKTIRNKTPRPIRITLAGGKVLHLGPARTGQIGDEAVTRPSVQALLQVTVRTPQGTATRTSRVTIQPLATVMGRH